MSQVIISNDVHDYEDCRDVVLRNRHGFVIGTIVDIENHFIVNDGRNKVVFVLDDGRKVFAEYTRLAKKKFIASEKMVESRIVTVNNVLPERKADDNPYAIGKTFYRDGVFAGVILSRGCDDFGQFVTTSSGMKIRVQSSSSDEFIDDASDDFFEA
jgi:hypothetical protein